MTTNVPLQSSALSRDLTLPTPAGVGASPPTTPRLVYGTAWKKERTADLVHGALEAGFRGIDTAAQPRHYREDLVGQGLRRAVADGIVSRSQVFLQTKFSPVGAQDRDNMPYDARAPLQEQVQVSIESSLRNLGLPSSSSSSSSSSSEGADEESYLDCVVLHSPLPSMEETVVVWKALSKWVPSRIRALGISNAPVEIVEYLLEAPDIKVKPSVVQNRFHERTGWEVDLRALCRHHGVIFQSFWTLSGNPQLRYREPTVQNVARSAGVEAEVALYALVLGLEGTTILDGTTSGEHMRADLAGIEKVGLWAESQGKETWDKALMDFKAVIGERT